MCMRVHIRLEDEIVAQLDRLVGPRQRSAFIAETVRRALEDERRWDEIEAAIGSIEASGHDWDADPAGWVRTQRQGDLRRVG
jgi:metal-responsive CopG/Arc/MetJ family transcriptional regulator